MKEHYCAFVEFLRGFGKDLLPAYQYMISVSSVGTNSDVMQQAGIAQTHWKRWLSELNTVVGVRNINTLIFLLHWEINSWVEFIIKINILRYRITHGSKQQSLLLTVSVGHEFGQVPWECLSSARSYLGFGWRSQRSGLGITCMCAHSRV